MTQLGTRTKTLVINRLKLTDLQLPGDASFALVSEVDLSLVVLCHHLDKLLGQDGMLGGYIQDCVHIPEPAAHKQERIKTVSTQEGKTFLKCQRRPSTFVSPVICVSWGQPRLSRLCWTPADAQYLVQQTKSYKYDKPHFIPLSNPPMGSQ